MAASYHGSPTGGIETLEPRVDPRTGKKALFISARPEHAAIHALITDRSTSNITHSTKGGKFVSGHAVIKGDLLPHGYLYELPGSGKTLNKATKPTSVKRITMDDAAKMGWTWSKSAAVFRAFGDEFAKIAAARSKDRNAGHDVSPIGAAAGLGVGATAGRGLMRGGLAGTLGAQTFVHGTSDEAAKGILEKGLLASHGGKDSGTSAAVSIQQFVDNSKGRVHIVSGSPSGIVSRAHASLAQAHSDAQKAGKKLDRKDANKIYMKGAVNPFHKGTVVGGALPYEEFKANFEKDPDHVPGAFRGRHDIVPERLSKGRPSTLNIIRARSKNIPAYLAANKGRAARGAAMLAAAPAVTYGAYRAGKSSSK